MYAFIISLLSFNKRLQYFFYVSLLISHLTLLFINAGNYRFAGNMNKTIVNELSKLTDKKKIYAIDLPQSQKGALILRNGFPEMVKWMFDGKFDTSFVCSERSELKPLREPYHITYTNNFKINCAASPSAIDSLNSLVLRFMDSTLEISK